MEQEHRCFTISNPVKILIVRPSVEKFRHKISPNLMFRDHRDIGAQETLVECDLIECLEPEYTDKIVRFPRASVFHKHKLNVTF